MGCLVHFLRRKGRFGLFEMKTEIAGFACSQKEKGCFGSACKLGDFQRVTYDWKRPWNR
jgi:hypothetical protein